MGGGGPSAPMPDYKGMWDNVTSYRRDARIDRDRRLAETRSEIAKLETRAKSRGGTFTGGETMFKTRSAKIANDYQTALKNVEQSTNYKQLHSLFTSEMVTERRRQLSKEYQKASGRKDVFGDESGGLFRRMTHSESHGEDGGGIVDVKKEIQQNLQFKAPTFDEWAQGKFGPGKTKIEDTETEKDKAYKRAKKAAGGVKSMISPSAVVAEDQLAAAVNPWI